MVCWLELLPLLVLVLTNKTGLVVVVNSCRYAAVVQITRGLYKQTNSGQSDTQIILQRSEAASGTNWDPQPFALAGCFEEDFRLPDPQGETSDSLQINENDACNDANHG